MQQPPSYPIVITNVFEVSLHATADLSFWRQELAKESLYPFDTSGSAQLLLMAMASKFNGIPFREFSISVGVSRNADGRTLDGYFLPQAFNSLRPFAWVERTLFHTPYVPGNIAVTMQGPIGATLRLGQATVFDASMRRAGHPPQTSEEWWEGPLLLPHLTGRTGTPRHYFFARIGGETEISLFDAAHDRFEIKPAAQTPIFRALLESNLRPNAWHIRRRATHSKSNTVQHTASPSTPFGY